MSEWWKESLSMWAGQITIVAFVGAIGYGLCLIMGVR
jgi:hypothetical protein